MTADSATPDSSTPISFEGLGLNAALLAAVESAGFTEATPVQLATIPAVLAGGDVRVRAETGSGKTAAFALPLLQRLIDQPRPERARGNPVAVLVLVPTRELAIQIADVFTALSRSLSARVKVLAVYGGVSINPQMMALRGGVDVLVATTGRLLDLQRQNAVALDAVRTLVLDEADRLLSLGFHDELNEVISLLPSQRQNLLLSATYPKTLSALGASLLREPTQIDLAPAATERLIEQRVFTVDAARKTDLLIYLIDLLDLHQVLVFVSIKKTGDALCRALQQSDLSAAVFHADKSQAERQRCLAGFRSGKLRVLIATDLAARGIDIEELPTVINLELPRSPNDYIHRIGRTGRAGHRGLAISLICPAEYQHFAVIEKRIKQRLSREQMDGFEIHS